MIQILSQIPAVPLPPAELRNPGQIPTGINYLPSPEIPPKVSMDPSPLPAQTCCGAWIHPKFYGSADRGKGIGNPRYPEGAFPD